MPVVLLLPLRTETESRHWGRTQAADSPKASRLDPISQAETTPATSPTSPGPSFQPPCPGTSWPVSPELPPPAMASGYWITELHLPVPVPSKQFIDAGAWPELQATLRISTSNLKQGLYSIIQARPALDYATKTRTSCRCRSRTTATSSPPSTRSSPRSCSCSWLSRIQGACVQERLGA
ncbi:hypothetical protein PVAP13_3NG125518 [Panicum virgatum]|uniref:Uncharacterized protein n=1 Tax=Panicum virgatum TaxID=38727 RepID=A0A8T0U5S5_PANVG|nr:hypothetical protein PVAP13_3NG125518 [Panicum virgatum]